MTRRLLTVGHGTLPADDFASLLTGAGVATLVDVRAFPGSRRHPHFGREQMTRWLDEPGVTYRWEPRLGGRRKGATDSPHTELRVKAFRAYADHMETGEFRDGLTQVLDDLARTTTAVMCSESLWWRCHRRMISDYAELVLGVEVEHLFHDGHRQRHPPMPEARCDPDRGLIYDGGRPRLLP